MILLYQILNEILNEVGAKTNPYGYWIDRHGNITPVKNWGEHAAVAKEILRKLGQRDSDYMLSSVLQEKYGFVRVAGADGHGKDFHADTIPMMHFNQLTPAQQKALRKLSEDFQQNLHFNGTEVDLHETIVRGG